MPVILALGRKRLKDQEFRIILGHIKSFRLPDLHETLSEISSTAVN